MIWKLGVFFLICFECGDNTQTDVCWKEVVQDTLRSSLRCMNRILCLPEDCCNVSSRTQVLSADQETRTEWDVSPLHWFKSLGNTRATWEICESTLWGTCTFKGGFLVPGMGQRDSHLRHMPAGCYWCWFGVYSTKNSTQAETRHRSFSVAFPCHSERLLNGSQNAFTCFVIL